jgi:glycopeptide antibiotics resistance protein
MGSDRDLRSRNSDGTAGHHHHMDIGGLHLDRGLVAVWMAPAVAALIASMLTVRSSRDTRRTLDRMTALLIAAYAVAVIAITLYPYSFNIQAGRILERGNWAPFGGTLGFLISDNSLRVRIASRDFLANIALFAPIGLLLGSRTRRAREVLLVVVLLVLMAFALEVVQGLTVAERTLDIDDAIAGSLGAIGAAVAGAVLPVGTTTPKAGYTRPVG